MKDSTKQSALMLIPIVILSTWVSYTLVELVLHCVHNVATFIAGK